MQHKVEQLAKSDRSQSFNETRRASDVGKRSNFSKPVRSASLKSNPYTYMSVYEKTPKVKEAAWGLRKHSLPTSLPPTEDMMKALASDEPFDTVDAPSQQTEVC